MHVVVGDGGDPGMWFLKKIDRYKGVQINIATQTTYLSIKQIPSN